MKHIRGLLKCPMITLWILFGLHFIYLLILFIIKKYISLVYLIIDIAILLILEFTALFITLSNHKNNYTFFLISLVLSVINALCILFAIFIIIFAIFEKEKLYNFIRPEPWIENEGKSWVGVVMVLEKLICLPPLIILIIYLRKIREKSGSIDPRTISINDEEIIAVDDPDNDKLI